MPGQPSRQQPDTPREPPKDFIERLDELDAEKQEREQLDPKHSYMRGAHLLPPRDEYPDLDRYVNTLKQLERAPATQLILYRFFPTLRQRHANAEALRKWVTAQRESRGPTDRHKRALGLVHKWCFVARSRGRLPLASIPPNTRDTEIIEAMRYLAPLVNDGSITRDELVGPIIEASKRCRHIPDNKSAAFVTRQIDDAIAKFVEPFDWDRLDDDC